MRFTLALCREKTTSAYLEERRDEGVWMEEKRQMKELPCSERPYEKCLESGPGSLSDAELLAVILRTGSRGHTSVDLAREILGSSRQEEGLLGLHRLSIRELLQIRGVGMVKAVQMKCICELSDRMASMSFREKQSFTSPESIAGYYMELLRHEEQERMVCLMLDTKNRFLGDEVISVGTVNSSLVSPREVFLKALQYHAVHIILVHNHPSGDASPSREDILVTERIRRAGELLGIRLLDHIVIGDRCFSSLLEEGDEN